MYNSISRVYSSVHSAGKTAFFYSEKGRFMPYENLIETDRVFHSFMFNSRGALFKLHQKVKCVFALHLNIFKFSSKIEQLTIFYIYSEKGIFTVFISM